LKEVPVKKNQTGTGSDFGITCGTFNHSFGFFSQNKKKNPPNLIGTNILKVFFSKEWELEADRGFCKKKEKRFKPMANPELTPALV
jgi:hypothetical protein